MAIGSTVIFRNEKYKIIWLYDNGTCEIKKNDSLGQVELVRLSELKIFEKNISSC
ncbi:hypothetical protein [Metabacillus rhizolycopersici]|uniref:Uncharacterized protein n=1 Tax=Metabacillus rhizolycopersici TaxID=2875709 RepID=A0ABS7USX2_9BACI|nr:hypothetical protein [Metabacillus rhizolycopersici]MBZ5751324.1 hypothetical protein [Metabacillus rhizolycopersici]